MPYKIVLIGAGNVGFHLGQRLAQSPHISVLQVYNRSAAKARALAAKIAARAVAEVDAIAKNADLYILAIKDDALPVMAKQLAGHLPAHALVAHTSGATPGQVLEAYFSNWGVFYPLQTFSQNRTPDWDSIPLCIEAHKREGYALIEKIARAISDSVHYISDEDRAILHVAAVFANNFSNHLFTIAADICKKQGIPFELLKPLIFETAHKLKAGDPANLQTGPAIRQDNKTILRHIQQLKTYPDYEKIYSILTNSIINFYNKK